jgi:hypothetical protein
MNKLFIPYEQSLDMKSIGFDEPCFGYHTDNEFQFFADVTSCNTNSEFQFYPTAPTFSQAFRWFREKHSLFHVITIADLGKYEIGNPDFQSAIYSKDPVVITNMDKCNTYEEADLACLIKLIQIVKQIK